MSKQYYLVTDSNAEEVEALTGFHGRDTPLGVLIEKPVPMSEIWAVMAEINEHLNPQTKCTCGHGRMAMWHKWNCPLNLVGC